MNSNKQTCKKSEILRKEYTRTNKKTGKKTRVSSACIKDRGLPGKWSDYHKGTKGIGKLNKGYLEKCGYYDVKNKTVRQRHGSLKKCIGMYGTQSVWRKLNAVYVYHKNTNPETSTIFKTDRDWIKKEYGISKKIN